MNTTAFGKVTETGAPRENLHAIEDWTDAVLIIFTRYVEQNQLDLNLNRHATS